MELLKSIFPDFTTVFHIAYLFIFQYYGWVIFVFGLIQILWRLYYIEIEHQFVGSQEWIFLQLKVPRENMVSSLAVESIFAQMHSLHGGKTFYNKYIEGQIQLWYSMEIISMGGKISFIMRIPAKMQNVVEAAFYSQYPQAEISVVDDYMENFKYDPYTNKDLEIFGYEWKLQEDDVVPIKTYKDFEHTSAEEKIIDPLSNFFETLAHINPDEFIGYQIMIQPLADEEWKPRGELKVKQLIEEDVPHKFSFIDFLLTPLNKFASLGSGGGHGHGHDENAPRNKWMSMTEAEKQRVTLIEKKISKPGYKTKIRTLYIAPKEKFIKARTSLMAGVWRSLGSAMTNKLKPDFTSTATSIEPIFSQTFEQGSIDSRLKKRKQNVFKGYKTRNFHIGLGGFILAIDEIATIFHFPITTKTTFAPAAVEKTESKKSQPPTDLPIAE